MLPKPSSCQGCPMYHDGHGFVPDENVAESKVFVMLPMPSPEDATSGVAVSGRSGYHFNQTLLPVAGLVRGQNVSVGHVLKCAWKHPYSHVPTSLTPSQTGAKLPSGKVTKAAGKALEKEATTFCLQAHTTIPNNVKVVVACGDMSWSSLGQEGVLEMWRGWTGSTEWRGLPVFGTYPAHYMSAQPRMSIPMMSDWKRLQALVDNRWPLSVPHRDIVSAPRPTVPDGTTFVTLDTEYVPDTYDITLIGIAYWGDAPAPLGGDQIPIRKMNVWLTKERLVHLVSSTTVVMHNALADITALYTKFGLHPDQYKDYQDTIQMHALLQSEWPHTLSFIESMHGQHQKMKHLSDSAHLLYNWGDCLTTGYAYKDMLQWMKKDPQSQSVYTSQNLPLVTTRFKSKQRGICLDRDFLSRLADTLQKRIHMATTVAEGYTGLPINIGSDIQVAAWLIEVDKLKLKKKRGKTRVTVDKDMVAELRRKYYDFDPDVEKGGITPEVLSMNIQAGGHPLLEARAAYQSAATLYNTWIQPFLSKDTYRKEKMRVFQPEDFISWISADQSTHSQASGRWSVTSPALTTLTYNLRGMLRPPEGYVMVKYDADQQELRLNAHLCNDLPTLEAFQNHWDVHTLNVCDIFQIEQPPDKGNPHDTEICLPWRNTIHWEGKDDKRRVFSKRFVYRLLYRGDPRSAGDIPGAKALGLGKLHLCAASENYLARHPALPKFWAQSDDTIRRTRTVRSFSGRKRFLNGDSDSKGGKVSAICREGTNHRMQSGGVDWSNLNILTIERETKDLTVGNREVEFVYGSFDSHNWFVPVEREHEFRQRVLEITDRPWTIDGRQLRLPITMDPTIYPLT